MNIMGMGWQEIMLILVGALLIFGPDRLPEVAGQIGKFVRDLRKMTGDLTGELERTAGVGDIKKAVQQELGGIQNTVNAATKGVSSSVSSATSSVNKAVTSAASAAKSTTTAAKSTTTATSAAKTTTTAKTATTAKVAAPAPKPVASKKDPLADVSFFAEEAPKSPKVVAAVPVETVSEPQPVVASNGHTKTPTSVASPDQLDALGRARQRRLSAGYNRTAS
ncbi:MAG: twin-arginine translocase TatA/TatE family subunit [Thermomicrobiales bacterium]|nr:twin-arginine translocase TatA/TatE family subunit [Thermomicrobiales bacterium]